jgi:hypothetical protein
LRATITKTNFQEHVVFAFKSAVKFCTVLPFFAASLAVHAQPSNLADAAISTTGFGSLKIGMSLEEAQKALGEPLKKLGSAADAACFLAPASNERLVLRMRVGKLVSVDTSSDQVGVTRSGIRVGETIEKVRAVYGKDSSFKESKSPFDQRPVTTVGAGANQVALAFTNGKVDLIRLGVSSELWGRCEP